MAVNRLMELFAMTPSPGRDGSRRGLQEVGELEFARYRKSPGDPADQIRFATYVLARNPEDVWALSALALYASDDAAFERQIRRAVRLGLLCMQARTEAGETVVVSEDARAEATLTALLLYATHLAARCRAHEATEVLKTMLEIDEADTVGGVAALERYGIVTGQGSSPNVN